VPIGAHGRFDGGALHLIAMVASPDGARLMRDSAAGTGDPAALGRELGERMLGAGARDILGS
jgi:porphobilinogen deaminase